MKLPAHPNRLVLLTAAFLSLAVHAFSAPGDLDPTFGGTGKITTPIGKWTYGRCMVVQADGKIVVAGESDAGTGVANSDFAVARYNPNGSPDPSFNGTGIVVTDIAGQNDYPVGMALQGDGKILVVGQSWNGNAYDQTLVRYDANGSLDTTFQGTGIITTGSGFGTNHGVGVLVQKDGKIVVTGGRVDDSGERSRIMRYNGDGSLDTTFNGTGILIVNIGVGAAVLQSDGRILLASTQNRDFTLARYNPDGSSDTTFGGAGSVITDVGPDDNAQAMALQSDGKIVVAGATGASPNLDIALVRYNSDGTLDTTFGNGTGKVITDIANTFDVATSVAVQENGKIVVAGFTLVAGTGTSNFALARYNPEGSLDMTFNGTGKAATDFSGDFDAGWGVALQNDGNILVAGYAFVFAGGIQPSPPNPVVFYAFALARYSGDPTLPIAATASATAVTTTGADLHGTVNANGQATTVQFEYGPTTSYGSSAAVTLSPDNGTVAQAVSAILSGLAPHTLYHYRLTATNVAGTSQTPDTTFTTASHIDAWRVAHFGANAGDNTIAGDLADPDDDALCNLLEYAFGGDPNADHPTPMPVVSQTGDKLAITFTRVPENDDLDYLVQASNNLLTWIDLASSHAGAATASLIGGVQVSEIGAGAMRIVEVVDAEAAGSLPRRFLRVQVVRP